MLKDDVDRNRNYRAINRAYHFRTILEDHELRFIWLEQENAFPLSIIKQRIIDNYKQKWYSELNDSSLLRNI